MFFCLVLMQFALISQKNATLLKLLRMGKNTTNIKPKSIEVSHAIDKLYEK